MYIVKLNEGYYVKIYNWIVNGPFDNEQDAQEYIDELTYDNCSIDDDS
ncbi:MAG: hypothetical protein MN733_05460 [Nitrososphaera sp.]|nr:hypothetical protein [Nitrososphaera sp.]